MPMMTNSEPETLRQRLVRFARQATARAHAEAKVRPPMPTLEQAIEQDRRDVESELRAIDKRVEQINMALAKPARPGLWGGTSYEQQENRSELRVLEELKKDLARDLECPITHTRDGEALDVRMRIIVRRRACELRASAWRQSEMYREAGLHREARIWRISSLNARREAEQEMGLRTTATVYL